MSEVEVITLDELKQRSEVIIEQIYSILTKKDIDQAQFNELAQIFEQSLSTLKKINDLQRRQQNEEITIDQTLKDSKIHQGEMVSMLNFVRQKSKRIADQRKSAVTYFELYHRYATEMKKATIYQKSIKLLDSEISQLQQLKHKHQTIHQQKTIFIEMQLNKQNEQGEFILEEITNENNEQLRKLKEKRDMILKELSRREIEYRQTSKKYEEDLKRKNQQIIQQLKQGKQETETKIKAKGNTTEKIPVQAVMNNGLRPFQTKVISFNEDRNQFKIWIVFLAIATILIVARMLTK